MAEYDKVLLEMPRDEPVLYLKIGQDGPSKIETTSKLKWGDDVVAFQAYDIVVNLFEDNGDTDRFLVLLGRWLKKVSWSKKIIVNRSFEDVDMDGIVQSINIVRMRIWVSEKQYAEELQTAIRVIRSKFEKKNSDIDAWKKFSSLFREDGWKCECGYINANIDVICANCLNFVNSSSASSSDIEFN